jgi:hypothetical protein
MTKQDKFNYGSVVVGGIVLAIVFIASWVWGV